MIGRPREQHLNSKKRPKQLSHYFSEKDKALLLEKTPTGVRD